MTAAKLVITWIVGGFFLFLGILIIRNLEMIIGVSDTAYYIALLIAFILVLLGGLCWISTAVAAKQ